MCVLLAVLMVFSTMLTAFAARADVTAAAEESEMCIYFDSETAGWSDAQYIGFHIWEIGGDALYDWGGKSERGTRVVEHDGDVVIETPALVWKYDFAEKGITLEDDKQYGVIFYSDKGAQTYNLLFGTECFGHTAQCDETIYENPEDSQKTTQAAFWDNSIDPEEYGPELKITSIGNVVGTCCPARTTPYDMFCDFLGSTFANARTYSGLTDQEILDNLGEQLDLTADDVQMAITASEISVDWIYGSSTLKKMNPPIDPHKPVTLSFDAKSAGWEDSEYIGFHIYRNDKSYYSWGSLKEYGVDEDGDGVWTFTVTDYKTNWFWYEWEHLIIFYNDKGDSTYPLVFDYGCFDDDVAYCVDGEQIQSPSDSSKTVLMAYWRNQDPKEYGPVIDITLSGEVIGECLPPGTNKNDMLQKYLTDHLETARALSGKSDQELIDDIAGALGVAAEVTDNIVYVLNYRGSDIAWREEDSPLERIWDPERVHVGPAGVIWTIETDREEQIAYELYIDTETFDEIGGTITFPQEAFSVVDARVKLPEYYEGEFLPRGDGKLDFALRLRDGVDIDSYPDYIPQITVIFDVTADSGKYRIDTNIDFDGKEEPWHFVNLNKTDLLLRGDYDTDGEITVMDATRAQRIIAELEDRPDEDFLIGIDADNDGELTVLDATRIQRVIADLCDWDGYIMGHLPEPSEYEEYKLPIVI